MRISENINEILLDIKKHSPTPERVNLIAVTKYVDTEIIKEVLQGGAYILGENKVQVLTKKHEELWDFPIKHKWHFIGNLQKNKVKYIANFIDMIHSVNKLSLALEINKRAKENNRIIDVLIEINLFQEESKEGYNYQDFLTDIPTLLTLENIRIKGLMTMAPYTENEELIRNGFKELRKLKNELNTLYFNNSLTELSMGMSNDYKIALEEGATFIRVGSKIFE
ncbi:MULTISPECIES: YggS family pyridoxal phosphate-dependent enzyme [Cetobacterium]|jgi:pyridoxal phosphate enzyme (YggS family)|uniref:Pyridoxal phosphate homeostasis protein n=1 Tax=Candidatus Cetobacterium colombiensis TaxID=3073100 RepID=A0ABU4W8H7_9FUSO|nr:YggS family pyridoxal phosphate-dependent enzyme [Candidatus Cetobacterium colombiensis]MDX8335817.1 YggS family pyridoxal phosphate-dependent enzyme [Candidatus Cetobacterium colombiensis]